MINAIVTSLSTDNLLATPNSNVELSELVGKKVRYLKNGKLYKGVVDGIEDPFIIIKFDEFPTGIGQGQIIEIIETPEEELQE